MAITQEITALANVPSLSSLATFESDMDYTLNTGLEQRRTEMNTYAAQANAMAVAMNLNSTTDTSASSVAIGAGAKSFTVSAGKSFQPGMWLVIADTAAPSSNQMYGTVTSYDTGTGALVMNIVSVRGSGTKTAWVLSQSAPGGAATGPNGDITSLTGLTTPLSVAQGGTGRTAASSTSRVNTYNGYGATNTKIYRYTNVVDNSGADITRADSAADGTSWTINTPGKYTINITAEGTTTNFFGASKNSTQLTTNINTITAADRIALASTNSGNVASASATVMLAVNDVIRGHGDGTGATTAAQHQFIITGPLP